MSFYLFKYYREFYQFMGAGATVLILLFLAALGLFSILIHFGIVNEL